MRIWLFAGLVWVLMVTALFVSLAPFVKVALGLGYE